MRIGVVDLGTNSTRLLVADVENGAVVELERRTIVTRLGEGVDATGRLSERAMARVREAMGGYREVIDNTAPTTIVAVATSAMRDAENGPAFRGELAERFDVDARTISGDEEARLTFRGAAAAPGSGEDERPPTMLVDIGGGSTEYVVGRPGLDPDFHVSTRMGSVRHTERFLESDPPAGRELAALAEDVRRIVRSDVPEERRAGTEHGLAVAGTATSLAAIDLQLDPYDPDQVHGHRVSVAACERMLSMLAARPVAERRRVTGLHPDRAPTIVAGTVILLESIRVFGLEEIEISEADILHGAALAAAEGHFPGGGTG